MSEVTIEQLQADNESLTAELEKVKAKNAELLDELKTVKKSRAVESLQEQIQALQTEKSELQEELRQHTYEKPLNAAFGEISPAEKHFRRAFEDYFSVTQDDEDGKFYICDKEGNYLTKEVKHGKYGTREVKRELNFSEVSELIYTHELKELDFFLPKPVGFSLPGSGRYHRQNPSATTDKTKKETKETAQFGIR